MGGRSAVQDLVPKPWGAAVAGLSYWTTKPARSLFARKYGAQPAAYDWAIGNHFLGDMYPGLNSRLPARAQHVPLNASQPFLIGQDPFMMPVTTPTGHLRILMPINRKHGPLAIALELQSQPSAEKVSARWNGREAEVGVDGYFLRLTVPGFKRGVNVLDLELGKNAGVRSFVISVPDNGLP